MWLQLRGLKSVCESFRHIQKASSRTPLARARCHQRPSRGEGPCVCGGIESDTCKPRGPSGDAPAEDSAGSLTPFGMTISSSHTPSEGQPKQQSCPASVIVSIDLQFHAKLLAAFAFFHRQHFTVA